LAALAVGAVSIGTDLASTASAQTADGWVTLFDGSNTDNFNQVGDANWRIADWAIEADDGGGHLVTRSAYTDFDLTLEFWVSADANSGVFIRASDPEMISAENAYEVNIFDTRTDQTYRTGGIVNLVAPSEVIMTGERWNTYQIIARGSEFTVILNGTRVVAGARDDRFRSGPITFQYGAGTVRFRNIRIRPL
jgi:hypothetical protein